MSLIQKSQPSNCMYCEKKLYGRSDQKFCNDNCRNTYNRYKRAYEKVAPPHGASEVIKVLKRNYEILKQKFPGQLEDKYGIHCDTNVVMQSGLNIKFYTSSFVVGVETYYCIFDRCYTIRGDSIDIIDVPEQMEI